jgi:hypothetical protein
MVGLSCLPRRGYGLTGTGNRLSRLCRRLVTPQEAVEACAAETDIYGLVVRDARSVRIRC